MRALLWLLAIIGFALWSGLAWAAYAFVDVSATWATGLVPGAIVDGWTSALALVGKGAILLIWAIGSIAILIAPLILGRVLGRSRDLAAAVVQGRDFRFRSGLGRIPTVGKLAERVAGRCGAKLLRRW